MKKLIIILLMTAGYGNINSQDFETRFGVSANVSMIESSMVKTSVNPFEGSLSTDIGTVGGRINLIYYFSNNLAFTASAGMLSSKVSTDISWLGVNASTATIIPIYFGAKYNFVKLNDPVKLKPFLEGAVGIMLASESSSAIFNNSVTMQTAPMAHIGGGLDLFLSRIFFINVGAGINIAADFQESVGGHDNYTCAEFNLGIGFLF